MNEGEVIDTALYAGAVVDDFLTTDRNGDLRLILSVMVDAIVTDESRPSDSRAECPQTEIEVWISLPASDEPRLKVALKYLELLGIAGDQFERLHPQHPDHFTLLGTPVYVRPKHVGDLVYWRLATPRNPPEVVPADALWAAIAKLAAKIAARESCRAAAIYASSEPGADGKL